MRASIIIKSGNDRSETLNTFGDYWEEDNRYIISYIESLYDNLITVDKETNTVIVEKQSTSNKQYYSKLVFELNKSHKCTFEVDGYSMFVNINSSVVRAIRTQKQLEIILEYTIEDTQNAVEVIVEWK